MRSGALLLRPWRLADAAELAAAWADEDIQRWTGVPSRCDEAAAQRWIGGDERRRSAWLSLDLVVERSGAVAGEVGLTAFDQAHSAAEIGWWTAPAFRNAGVAATAAALVADWALGALGLNLVTAQCAVANGAAVAVARRAGLATVSTTDGIMLLSRRSAARRHAQPDGC